MRTLITSETVLLAQAGDETATRQLIRDLHQPMLGFIYRILGPQYRGEMEDIAQDVMLKVFRALDRFDVERGVLFTTWVFTFVRNHCLDVLKKKKLKTSSLSSKFEEEGQWDLTDERAMQPRRQAELNEFSDAVDTALQQIDAGKRQVFVMREQLGMEYDDIAKQIGVAEGTVKSRLHRARLALREILSEFDPRVVAVPA